VKVVFIEDVPDVALAGETRVVADGYGRNYLLPKKLAVLANSSASNIVKAQMKKVLVKRAHAAAEMKEIAEKLEGVEITVKARVGEKERLYGSVTGADIASGIVTATGLTVDKRKIDLDEPIRQLGTFDVTVKFAHDITAAIKVTVEPDKVEEEEKEERKPRSKKEEETAAVEGEQAEASAEEASEAEIVAEEIEAEGEELQAEAMGEEVGVAEEPVAEVVEESEAKVEEPAEAEAAAEEETAADEDKE